MVIVAGDLACCGWQQSKAGRCVAELSVLCEPVSTWRISAHEQTPLFSKHLPLCQGGGATFLECGAVDEVAFLGKVIVERSVNGRELLQ